MPSTTVTIIEINEMISNEMTSAVIVIVLTKVITTKDAPLTM